MANRRIALAVTVASLMAGSTLAAELQTVRVPFDGETPIAGVPVACTGVGQTKLDPHWASYPVRVEFSGAKNEYLADEAVTLRSASGREVLSVSCEGPWILLNPKPGAYRVEGRLLDDPAAKPQSASFKPPAKGQMRVVLQFKDADASAPAAAAPASAP